jgi:tetratricopeptide (TPR) repeat protein
VRARHRAIGVVSTALAALILAAPASAQSGGLTGAAQIARVYDAILDARFEEVPDLLQQTCGPVDGRTPLTGRTHPSVCQLLETVSLWWQIQLDPADRSRDSVFETKADEVIDAIDAWTRLEPQRAEAWFYLGGAYGARGQWRVLRGQVLAAARDGKRIKDALERSLTLDPGLTDAYFGIGLYHYYADVAPAAAKMLRFLLFLPGGDKTRGLREMQQARDGGQLLRSEADYQLHVLYLWYERQPLQARNLIAELRRRHPRNPHFAQVIAEINDTYLHDDTASLRAWQDMLAAAQAGRLALASMAETRARIGIATQLDRLQEPDLALEQLRVVLRAAPPSPFGSLAQASLLSGRILDSIGSRAEALDAYRRAISAAGPRDPLGIATEARRGLRNAPDADTARARRLSIDGWRALERGLLPEASRLLTLSLEVRPDEPVTMYRMARLHLAQNDSAAALRLLQRVVATRTSMPPTFLAYACLDAASVLEQQGKRGEALDLYRRAAGVFGADDRTRNAARNALTRLSRPVARDRRRVTMHAG